MPIPVLAVIVGVLADRKVQRFSDVLTGRGLAQLGAGIGLVCGLTSVTIIGVQFFMIRKEVDAFSRVYEKVLASGSFAEAIWWAQAPVGRETTSPEKLVAEMTDSPQNAQMFEQKNSGLRTLKKDLAFPGVNLHYDKLEAAGLDGLNMYGVARYAVHLPANKDHPDREQYVLSYFKAGKTKKGQYEWWVEAVNYPASSTDTFTLPTKAPDDGHGHAH
jgi:hypothetical protein